MLGSHCLVDQHPRARSHPPPGSPAPGDRSHACVRLSRPGNPPPGQPSLGDLDGRYGARGSAHAFEPYLWSGCDRQDGAHPIRLDAGPVDARSQAPFPQPDRAVKGDERRSPGNTASTPAAQRCRPSRSRSASGPEPARPAGRDRSRRRSRRCRHRVGSQLRPTRGRRTPDRGSESSSIRSIASPSVRVPRARLVRQHRDAVEVADLPRVGAVNVGPGGRRRAVSSRRPPEGAGPPRCTGGRARPGDPSSRHRSLAERLGEPVTGLGAGIQDAFGIDRDRAGRGRPIGLEPRGPAHEHEDASGASVCNPVIPNCLSGSPSWKKRMLRRTLSSGWLTSAPATPPSRPLRSSARPTAGGSSDRRGPAGGRRAIR